MHWVIQENLFKRDNLDLLQDAVQTLDLPHSLVTIPAGTLDLQPEINPVGKVYVCGAIKLAQIARARGWHPGSFLNDQFRQDYWQQHLAHELLNAEFVRGTLADIRPPLHGKFFIRPLEDNKAINGQIIDHATLHDWRNDPQQRHLLNLPLVASPLKEIYREYRLFIVQRQVVTGSLYKVAGKPYLSEQIEPDVIEYAKRIIANWLPIESVVLDIALTEQGFKVIEFNNINSSSFYASNVKQYVAAIEAGYD